MAHFGIVAVVDFGSGSLRGVLGEPERSGAVVDGDAGRSSAAVADADFSRVVVGMAPTALRFLF